MAKIGPCHLTITLDGNGWADVLVTYTITWSTLDKQNNLGYWEDVTLWGSDWFDNRIRRLSRTDVYSNGLDTLEREITARMKRSALDEDPAPGDDDEIYAQVILQDKEDQFPRVRRNSNKVTLGD